MKKFLLIFLILLFASPVWAVLSVHPTNPRYFMDRHGNIIYLTGSHTWANWVDFASPPTVFDWDAYLAFLQGYGHNYIRLWASETTEYIPYRYKMSGSDFDLTLINPTMLSTLRRRVQTAGARGMYVGINLFRPDHAVQTGDWAIHPFNSSNNINSINGDTNSDGKGYETYDITPEITAITDLQKAWIVAVVDAVNEFDNVLYEIGNEGDWSSEGWQKAMIDYLIAYQAGKTNQHPVIMSSIMNWLGGTGAVNDSALLSSNAHAVGFGGSAYGGSATINDGTKVSILDNDHFFGDTVSPKGQWIWRAFMRGHNPVLMDWYTYSNPPYCTVAEQIEMRKAMGHILYYATKMNLVRMAPSLTISSTNYALYRVGEEYLVYQPDSGSFIVHMTVGSYFYEWFNPTDGCIGEQGTVVAEEGVNVFVPPFYPSVLYLKKPPQNATGSMGGTVQ